MAAKLSIAAIMTGPNQLKTIKKWSEGASTGLMPARLLMVQNVLTLEVGTTIKNAIQIFKTKKINGAPIVDPHMKLIGIVSQYDLLLQAASKDINTPLVFNDTPFYVHAEEPLKDLIVHFYRMRFRQIPVVDDSRKIIGIVARIDVLAKLIET